MHTIKRSKAFCSMIIMFMIKVRAGVREFERRNHAYNEWKKNNYFDDGDGLYNP